MKDVALYTGLSTATVSRVLNDNYPVSAETRKKVLDAFEKLDYEPNLVAKSLRSRKSNLVAIIVADIENPYYMRIAKQIDKYLFNKGYNLITCSTDESLEKEQEILKMLMSKNIDAIAISPCDSESTDLAELIKREIPITLIDRKLYNYGNLPYVGTDNYKETYDLTKQLILKGHKDIGIITGTLSTSTGLERLEGFKAALQDYNIPFNHDWLYNGEFVEETTYKVMIDKLNKMNNIPTAIVSCNNVMTKGALSAIKENNLKVPNDISIVTYGALANNNLFKVKITSLEQDTISMGEAIATSLINQLEKVYLPTVEVQESIIIKGNSIKEIK
ncbi:MULTISPECIES: LacI family DNA-binding transcriptional regulator [Mammaliicoccus]|uniref:LacI family transcriptional regulator n=2 Tax=Mammaliicoccus sciuri TaxID=1296 RepID=A0AAW5LI46_MAMSC|nr:MULTISPECIES: LacI family DNA-binding transcriptional regulator [Mammaliicoccus]KTT84281.1 hypothetical protein NS202_03580 [Mammaliicoccus sciuri]MBF0720400.1 LacI family DNA-binding transcriptional regulator [Mammaliicoccus sciuri]MBG9211383.1 LacI family DNA-binding transcriptional regulator [Mammaliicoccus sciuri]MBO1207565.1 LacI family DNA-binding transcriptional regulator [Mammaliicoccus sciuri]MCD5142465.1 LacI family DNA-binding transcriptional regulator [Mammaliicoccus sciuri]